MLLHCGRSGCILALNPNQMKKRIFNVLNFLALNILFFAIYLNFVQKDAATLPPASIAAKNIAAASNKSPVILQQKNAENIVAR